VVIIVQSGVARQEHLLRPSESTAVWRTQNEPHCKLANKLQLDEYLKSSVYSYQIKALAHISQKFNSCELKEKQLLKANNVMHLRAEAANLNSFVLDWISSTTLHGSPKLQALAQQCKETDQ
jgi:hypothetical protein